MPPFGFMALVMFDLRYKTGGGRFFYSLALLRASLKYRDGSIYGRLLNDDSRPLLETWENGVRVWVSPDYDAYMSESQARIDAAAKAYRVTDEFGPGTFSIRLT
jgi:hypothetical protein